MSAARVIMSTAASTAAAREIVEQIPLAAGWELGSTREALRPDRLDALDFVSTQVPGTISGASDSIEYWLRCRFDADPAEPGEEVLLRFGGIATVSEAWLNGHPILSSTSMFAAHDADVSALLRGRGNELLIVCRSLTAALRAKRGHAPAARWRTRVVSEQQLRWFRTTVLGRAPGFAPGPPAVGLRRPVMLERRSRIVVDDFSHRVWLDGSTGVIEIEFRARALQEDAKPVSGRLISDRWSAPLEWDGSAGRASLRIPDAQRWWPHTHGDHSGSPHRLSIDRNGSGVWAQAQRRTDLLPRRRVDTGRCRSHPAAVDAAARRRLQPDPHSWNRRLRIRELPQLLR
jgi:beta-mannosidase